MPNTLLCVRFDVKQYSFWGPSLTFYRPHSPTNSVEALKDKW